MLAPVALSFLSTLVAAPGTAPDVEPPPFELRGQVGDVELWLVPAAQLLLRAEVDGARDLSGAPPTTPIQQRTRFGFDAGAGELVSMRLRVQDVRFWGGEIVPPGQSAADPARFGVAPVNIEMFEGYLGLHAGGLELRFGRQVLHLDRGRLVGEAPWAMKSRSFDAARGIWRIDGHEMTAFAAVLQDEDAPAGAVTLPDQWLLGAHGRLVILDELVGHPVLLVDTDSGLGRLRWTLGALVDGEVGGLRYETEAYYQGADVPAGLTNAYFAGAEVTYGFTPMLAAPRVGGRVNVLSGDTDRTSTLGASTFDPPFGSRHWPLGLADLFINIPADTRDQGLIDVAALFDVTAGPFRADAALHLFTAAAPENPNASPLYGFEPDVVAGVQVGRHLEIQGGAALFVPLGPALGRGNQMMPWTYLQLRGEL